MKEVSLYFGQLVVGALLRRCRTDTHKIVLTIVNGKPVAVRLEKLDSKK